MAPQSMVVAAFPVTRTRPVDVRVVDRRVPRSIRLIGERRLDGASGDRAPIPLEPDTSDVRSAVGAVGFVGANLRRRERHGLIENRPCDARDRRICRLDA